VASCHHPLAYFSYSTRYEHDFGVYPNVFEGELFNGATSERLCWVIL